MSPADSRRVSDGRKDLPRVVTAVAGVIGIEPGISSTMRVVRARAQGQYDSPERYGIIVSEDGTEITVEVSLDGSRPVREVVSDIQKAVHEVMPGLPVGAPSSTGRGSRARPKPAKVSVRVQSIG